MKTIKFLLVAIITIALASCQNYSSGERVGVITKCSEKGVMFKSFEIDLKIAPGLAQGSQMVGNYETFEVSIDNDQLIKCETSIDSIKYYASQGIPVVVEYQQVKFLNWFNNRGETDYFIKSIHR